MEIIREMRKEIKKRNIIDIRREGGITAVLGLTYICQCNCVHCGMAIYEKNISTELKTADWLKIIDELSINKIKDIVFFGGEPTLRDDLAELVSAVKKRGITTVVDTNGYLLTNNFVKKMKIAGLDFFEISIDSSSSKIHDDLRGVEGVFNKMQEGIKNCKSNDLGFLISTYATKDNIKNGELKKIINLARKMGAIYVRVLSPILIGKWLNKDNFNLNESERKALNNILDDKFAFSEEKYCIGINKKLIYISPYGEIQPCPYIPFTFGNVKKESIKSIIDKMWGHSMYKIETDECLMNNEKFRKKYIKIIKNSSKFPIDLVKK